VLVVATGCASQDDASTADAGSSPADASVDAVGQREGGAVGPAIDASNTGDGSADAGSSAEGGGVGQRSVLVVINDSSPTSIAVATAYMQGRGLTEAVHVQCADSAASQDNETIAFSDYQTQIEVPIRAYVEGNADVTFIVTTKGVPIRISGAGTGETAGGTAQTSLDDYLAALDYDKVPGAKQVTFAAYWNPGNPYATGQVWLNRYWNARVPFTHAQFGGYLVTRLDGYTQDDAIALATRALTAEQGLQPGEVLLDLEPDFGIADTTTVPAPIAGTIQEEYPFGSWNADMVNANSALNAEDIPTFLNMEPVFVGNKTDLLGYFSWGSNDDHWIPDDGGGVGSQAYNSLGFLPGAIGDTAVSSSARSFFPQTSGQSMIADLIAQGITGVKGYTDEPLLQSNVSPTILMDRYTHGFTLAESFYAASHFVGWTQIVLGDPLTRPYPPQGSGSSGDAGTDAGFCSICGCDNGTCPTDSTIDCHDGTACQCSVCTCTDGSCAIDAMGDCDNGNNCTFCFVCLCDDGTCPTDSAGDCDDSTNCVGAGDAGE
jgi:uncharacterized protein (TIGR03790 family)